MFEDDETLVWIFKVSNSYNSNPTLFFTPKLNKIEYRVKNALILLYFLLDNDVKDEFIS